MQNTYTSKEIIKLIDSQLALHVSYAFQRIEYYPNLFGAFNTLGLVYKVNKFTVFVIITAHDGLPKLELQYPVAGIQMNAEINIALINAVHYANVHLKNSGRFKEDPI